MPAAASTSAEIKKGLEGVVALETAISFIDGKKGVLEYRGYSIEDIAAKLDYPAVAYLLLYSRLPNKAELAAFTRMLRRESKVDEDVLAVLRKCPKNIDAMDALRTAVSYLAHCDRDLNDNSLAANLRKGVRLIAKMPTIVAAFYRIKSGQEPVAPHPRFSRGANFLYMLTNKRPSELEARAVETDFVLTAEHELNASTFAARIAISTLSDLHSAICSGISTLKGPLHGGARLEVIKMLEEIGDQSRAEKYVLDALAAKKRIMGFGHRVYKTYDPRAKIFKQLALDLAKEQRDMRWFNIAETIEATVLRELVEKRGKPIYPNVDFYAGVLYEYLRIPKELSTAMFALGRVSGWIAHCLEQFEDNKLIRPVASYVGPHGLKI